MTITKTLTLVAAPEPPFIGTTIRIAIPDGANAWGIYAAGLADDSEAITIAWGDDREPQTVSGGVEKLVHTYPSAGEYTIRVSDDASYVSVSGDIESAGVFYSDYAPMVRSIVHNGTRLAILQAFSGWNCAALERVEYPAVVSITGRPAMAPFKDCSALTEIHFGAANETTIRNISVFKAYPNLLAPNATAYFDL